MSHFSVSICVIFTNFCLVTLFDHKLQAFNNSPKWTIFGICNQLFSAQNVKVARFARNVECDFFCDIQTQCEEMQFWHFFKEFWSNLKIRKSKVNRYFKNSVESETENNRGNHAIISTKNQIFEFLINQNN